MNLVDSSGWLEFFAGGKNADFFAPIIEDKDNLVVSTINLYEVYRKFLSELDERSAVDALGIMLQAQVVDVDYSLSLAAAKISIRFKLPMADSLIYATALQNDATVWTQDKDFRDLENVKFVEK